MQVTGRATPTGIAPRCVICNTRIPYPEDEVCSDVCERELDRRRDEPPRAERPWRGWRLRTDLDRVPARSKKQASQDAA